MSHPVNASLLRNQGSWLRADSYKYGQFLQYPDGMTAYHGYIESRGGNYENFPFFGLQAFLLECLSKPLTVDSVNAMAVLMHLHGEPFNHQGFMDIVTELDGKCPVEIWALPEGTICQPGIPQVAVRSTNEKFAWVGGFIETQCVRAVWYGTTVAAISYNIRKSMEKFIDLTSDNPDSIIFKLHDFGQRGVSSEQSAELGGAAHLVNFSGTDTIDGLLLAMDAYGYSLPHPFIPGEAGLPGLSIPATEHSTQTAKGPQGEAGQVKRHFDTTAGYPIVACVADSYDFKNHVTNIVGGLLREQIINSNRIWVVRPDSGDPLEMCCWAVQELDRIFGHTVNSKGYKVLNHVRLIQGDGVCPQVITDIMHAFAELKYSVDNIAFGMGGALLQKLDRDTLKYAMKCSALTINGEWVDVYKDPITDHGKKSKRGQVTTYWQDGKLTAGTLDKPEPWAVPAMELVFKNGEVVKTYTFEEVRRNAHGKAW